MLRSTATGTLRTHTLLAAPFFIGLLLAGCSTGIGGLSGGPLPYQASNAIVSTGYSETQIGPDRYRIEVKGPVTTPRERLEKIATTRAAEIGKDARLGYFKIDNVAVSFNCQTFMAGGDRGGSGATKRKIAHAVLTAEVTYTKAPPDPGYIEAKTAFDQLRAELDLPAAASPLPDPATTNPCT